MPAAVVSSVIIADDFPRLSFLFFLLPDSNSSFKIDFSFDIFDRKLLSPIFFIRLGCSAFSLVPFLSLSFSWFNTIFVADFICLLSHDPSGEPIFFRDLEDFVSFFFVGVRCNDFGSRSFLRFLALFVFNGLLPSPRPSSRSISS